MHAAAYQALNMPHTFEAIRTPHEELAARVDDLRNGLVFGLCITVPHKTAVVALADELSPSVAIIGAANTLVRVERRIVAHNTDSPALALELLALAPELRARSYGGAAIVLGAGGASRAAIAALALDLGVARVVVKARAFADNLRANAFASSLQQALAAAGSLTKIVASDLRPSPSDAEAIAIVQGTSAGMTGADSGDGVAAAIDWHSLSGDACAIDVVYAPPVTPFLRAASSRQLRCANGLGMLARQGALAFQLWLGREAPFDAMRAAIDGI